MKKQIEVVAAAIIKDHKIFCAQRHNNGEVGLKWEFPGGKVEPGESKEEALIREIREELNSEIKVEKYLTTVKYEYDSFSLSLDLYQCQLVKGNLELLEHINAKWIDGKELKNLDWAPADLAILDLLASIL